MFDDNESSASGFTTGAKIAILVAIPFIALGVYFLIAPITEVRTTTGAVFGCGSAIGAPDDQFKTNICQPINTMYLYRGLISIAAGLLIAGAGFFLFNDNDPEDSDSGFGPNTGSGETGHSRTFD